MAHDNHGIESLPSSTAHALGSVRNRLAAAGTARHLTALARDADEIARALAAEAATERKSLEERSPNAWRLREVAANEAAAEKAREIAAAARARAGSLNSAT